MASPGHDVPGALREWREEKNCRHAECVTVLAGSDDRTDVLSWKTEAPVTAKPVADHDLLLPDPF